ncbi:hypothetical protein PR048_019816 [Dryococelus australis]|uniref:Transposase n=1 Tax=Dryococelus australis TaxID=614101 RepID=A0ABQ9H4I9_9NEOP|nr:hypothetical protein PR048_019816 [Dryococelus australis]
MMAVGVRRYSGDRNLAACIVERHSGQTSSVMVWGAIGYIVRSGLLCIENNLNRNRYIREVLEPEVLPLVQATPHATFQQNNARPHVARDVQAFFNERRVPLLPWPARSPDMSPIEHIWDLVGRRSAKGLFGATFVLVAQKREMDNSYTESHIKCVMASTRKVLNLHAVFSLCCLYLRDFKRLLISDRDFEPPISAVRNELHLDLQSSSELERSRSTKHYFRANGAHPRRLRVAVSGESKRQILLQHVRRKPRIVQAEQTRHDVPKLSLRRENHRTGTGNRHHGRELVPRTQGKGGDPERLATMLRVGEDFRPVYLATAIYVWQDAVWDMRVTAYGDVPIASDMISQGRRHQQMLGVVQGFDRPSTRRSGRALNIITAMG